MAQHKDGLIRVLDGQQTVMGSWVATVTSGDPAPLQGDPTFETCSFAPSGAAGIYIDDFNNGNQVKFFVTSGTPADGDTLTGDSSSASVTIGNPVNETLWQTNSIAAPHTLVVAADKFATAIGSVGAEDRITLAANYSGGSNKVGVSYAIIRDFSATRKYPLLTPGDLNTIPIYDEALRKIDADMDAALSATGVTPPEPWQAATLDPAWSAVAGYATLAHRIYQTFVELRGYIEPATTVSDGAPIFQLPAGDNRRPAATLIWDRMGYAIEVRADGNVVYRGNDAWDQRVTLQGIIYRGES